ncbi:MAG: type II toxin-antitoxin system HigB family toxin [Thermodesulfobacteriota bacterium]
MRVISIKKLKDFLGNSKYKNSEQPLRAWHSEAKKANWKTPDDIKKQYRNASFLSNNRVVFNIKGNDYRLIAAIKYEFQIIYIRFIGTHKQYDKINAKEI